MKNQPLVEPLLLVAVRLGLGETTEMQLMVDVLRGVAAKLERQERERTAKPSEETP